MRRIKEIKSPLTIYLGIDFNKMIKIQVKSCVIEPLFSYMSELNSWHEKTHNLTADYCKKFLETIKPIEKQIKEKELKERKEHHWHYCSNETDKEKEAYKQLKKIISVCKSALQTEQIELKFI